MPESTALRSRPDRSGENLTAVWVLLSALVVASTAAQARPESDAWEALEGLRENLVEASPLSAEFSQTFTPSGFSSGDTETGRLAMDVPDCARWDYSEPFARSYLLCGNVAFAWNPGETSGRRFELSDGEQEGLDLLRLDVDDLRRRYDAEIRSLADGLEIRLSPVDGGSTITEAWLLVTHDLGFLGSLAFVDAEGNRTVFEIGEPDRLSSSESLQPPTDIEWLGN